MLRIFPTDGVVGTLPSNTNNSSYFWPWHNYRGVITKVIIEGQVCTNKNAYCLFLMLGNCTEMELTGLDVSNTTNMGCMFQECRSLRSLDLSNFDTSSATDMNRMFSLCNKLTHVNMSSFDTDKVTLMCYMFYDCNNLASLDLSVFDTSKVTDMAGMFYGCRSLDVLDASNFNTSCLTNMSIMFKNCSSLTSLDLSSFNTSNVTNMDSLFNSCANLNMLNINGFSTSKVTNMNNMFGGCSNLVNLRLSKDFNFIGTNHRFSDTGNDWVKVRHADGKKTYDSTTYLATQIATLNNIDSTPLLGGTWIKNHTGDDYATNPDGSIEYISEDDYWIINSDNVWTYSFSVFDDSLLFYLYEDIIGGYNSEAMAPYYITVKDNTVTIVNEKEEDVIEIGKLFITKTVKDVETDEQFEFTIILTGTDISGKQIFNNVVFNDGVGKILLGQNEAKVFDLPVGTEFTVSEKESVRFESAITPASGVISKDTLIMVNATNTYIKHPVAAIQTVNITVKKTVENCPDDSAKFLIGASFKNLKPNETYETSASTKFVSDAKGEAFCNIELGADEEVVIFNIPKGATYQFTEQSGNYISSYSVINNGNGGDDTIVKKNDENVKTDIGISTALETAEAGEDIVITFHNKFETVQDLTIKNIVYKELEDGTIVEDADCNEAFEYTITFKGLDEGTTFKSTIGRVTAGEDGEASKTFYLKHGESVVFYDIPVGVQYEIVKSKSVYTPSYTVEGTIVEKESGNTHKGNSLSTALETVNVNESGIVTFMNIKMIPAQPIYLKKSIDAQGNEDVLRALEHNSMYTLAGAEYQIIVDGEVVETLVTDANGEAISAKTFRNGVVGVVKEITPPNGFLLDESEHEFIIDLSDNEDYCEINVSDIPTFDPTVFRFRKTARGTGVAQGNTSFEGAVFKYEYFDNTEWSGEPVRTWYFETNENGLHAYHINYLADGYVSDELYTSVSGVYTIPLGSVKITEVVSPLGYKELPIMYATIIQETSGAEAKWVFTPETIDFLKTASNDLYEGDEPMDEETFGSFTITKVDKPTNKEEPEAIFDGCEFTIYNMSTNPVKIGDNEVANNGEPCMTIVIGEDGTATTGAVLPIGSYEVRETKGNEYYSVNTEWSYRFTIDGSETNPVFTATCENAIKPEVRILKTDNENNSLAGAKLQIKNADGEIVAEWVSTTEDYVIRLDEGTYILDEKTPPSGYWFADDIEFTVTQDGTNSVVMVDVPLSVMVSTGGTGTIITVIIAAVFGCITGICIYLSKKKSKKDKILTKQNKK